MDRICDNEKNQVFVPELVRMEALEAMNKVVPTKSKKFYEKEYQNFCEWRKRKETIILAYISERSKIAKSSSLWAYYSQLQKMLSVKENIDISRFHQVSAFLKQQSVGHRPKKSMVFTLKDMERFLDTALDDEYLPHKVVLIVGVFGGCRVSEFVAMSVDDVDDRGNVIVVNIPDTKTYKPRTFTIINGSNYVYVIDVFRKYRKLRPGSILHKRNKLHDLLVSEILKNIRVTALDVRVQLYWQTLGVDLAVVKRRGGWRSNSVVEGYIEDSLNNKIDISRTIINHSSTNIQEALISSAEACISASKPVSNQNMNLPINGTYYGVLIH